MAEPARLEHQKSAKREQEKKQETGHLTAPPEFKFSSETGETQSQQQIMAAPGMDFGAEGDYTVPQAIIINLRRREEWLEEVMLDELGLPIAGMKHVLTAEEKARYQVGDKIPTEVLEAWAQADLWKAYEASMAQCNILGISDQEFVAAMTAVNFQLGTAWHKIHKSAWGNMAAHEWEQAAILVEESTWYAQTPERAQDFQEALRMLASKAPSQTTTTETLGGSNAQYAFEFGPALGSGKVISKTLNVRLGPGTQFDKTGAELKIGSALEFYGQANGWYCLGEGQWVAGQYVELDSAPPSTFLSKFEDGLPDLKPIAQNVYDAMFADQAWGANEEKAFRNLALLKKNAQLIAKFKATYAALFGRQIEADIRSEFSDTFLGSEQTMALGYLQEASGPSKAPDRISASNQGQSADDKADEQPIQPVLRPDQWCSQLRWGYNFKAKDNGLEQLYATKVEQLTGLCDPAELHKAKKADIQAIRQDKAFAKGHWCENEALKSAGLKADEKLRPQHPNWDCSREAALKMLQITGAKADTERDWMVPHPDQATNPEQNDSLVAYLDGQLMAGSAVLASLVPLGQEAGKQSKTNSSQGLHFVVIVGKGKDKFGAYYTYFDPGTNSSLAGTDPENRFYLQGEAAVFAGPSLKLAGICPNQENGQVKKAGKKS